MPEQWKPVKGQERYEVSDLGRVRRVSYQPLKPIRHRGGYLRVSLPLGLMSVHGLVAQAFIGDRPEGREVNHIDGNPANNYAKNLEYVTHAENVQHSFTNLARRPAHSGESTHFAKLTDYDVAHIRRLRREGQTYAAIAAQFNTKPANVWHICQGRTWKHLL